MNSKELIMVYDTDIKELFMSDAVEEILITTDSKGLSLDESSQVGDIDWFKVIELGIKKIVISEVWIVTGKQFLDVCIIHHN